MKSIFLSLLCALLSLQAVAQVSFGQASLFNDAWLFQLGDDSLAINPTFDDSKWRQLDLPHDWSVEGRLSPTLASCTGYYPGGIAWYRKHFTLNSKTSTLHYIYFEGVYNRSTVYLNGHELGYRPSGFASFCYELTPYLQEGDNVLSVRVDHSRYPTRAGTLAQASIATSISSRLRSITLPNGALAMSAPRLPTVQPLSRSM